MDLTYGLRLDDPNGYERDRAYRLLENRAALVALHPELASSFKPPRGVQKTTKRPRKSRVPQVPSRQQATRAAKQTVPSYKEDEGEEDTWSDMEPTASVPEAAPEKLTPGKELQGFLRSAPETKGASRKFADPGSCS
jgi:hypothetical protein